MYILDASMNVRSIFRFPDTVNETSARLVAAGVITEAAIFLIFREGWLLIPLVYGFLARVLAGPTLSPLGQFVTRVATPALETWRGSRQDSTVSSRVVPGPPKRFAQGIGLAFTSGAALAWLLGAPTVSVVLIVLLVGAATLESVFAVCLGCIIYNAIWGCPECGDLSLVLQVSDSDVQPESAGLPSIVASPTAISEPDAAAMS